MTPPKQPPPGVETTPGGPVVPLKEAAARLSKDPRTVIRAITNGELRGGAIPRPERLRWYVYVDALPPELGAPAPTPPPAASYVEDLQAQLVSQMAANQLLIAAQHTLLEADATAASAADKYRAVAQQYLDALAQFMTPGNISEFSRDL